MKLLLLVVCSISFFISVSEAADVCKTSSSDLREKIVSELGEATYKEYLYDKNASGACMEAGAIDGKFSVLAAMAASDCNDRNLIATCGNERMKVKKLCWHSNDSKQFFDDLKAAAGELSDCFQGIEIKGKDQDSKKTNGGK